MRPAAINQPMVSIIMPVFNAERFVGDALQSILNQTYTKFEFIIIDDGSKDESLAIVKKYADPRIRLISLPQNEGIVYALNTGLQLAHGKYVARMDADDISLPQRLALQVAFMETHPEVGLLGTQHIALRGKSRFFPTNHTSLVWYMLNACPFIHPSVMMRADVLKQHELKYNKEFEYAEDLELWTRMCMFTQVANLPQKLIKYRYHFATHERNKQTAALLNNVIKINHLQTLCPTIPHGQLAQLATYLNHHIKHPHSIVWFDEFLAFMDSTVKQVNKYEFEQVCNKACWFHLASSPKLFLKLRRKLKQHKWIKLKPHQVVWLIAKSMY